MATKNRIKMVFSSNSENVGVARIAASAFAAQLDLTLGDIEEIKVAISEAVSNSIIHGYRDTAGEIELLMELTDDDVLEFVITDYGRGIADVEQARQPSFSTDPERMGLGFVFMESFMDGLTVESKLNKGTTVRMMKKLTAGQSH